MSEPAQRAIEPPEAAASSPAAETRALFDRATACQRAGDADTAFALYCQLLERSPPCPMPTTTCVILKTQKHLPAAIACLKRALVLAPNSGPLHSNLGDMLWMNLRV